MASKKSKLKELIIYISTKCSDDKTFGVTKLNKILFYADYFYYLNKNKSISEQNYIHLDHGPVPEDMIEVRDEMIKKDIAYAFYQSGPFLQKRVVALREPKIDSFEPDMISLLDEIIDEVSNKKHIRAKWMSDATHDFLGWLVTEKFEVIPYETFLLKDKKKQKVEKIDRLVAVDIANKLKGEYGFAE